MPCWYCDLALLEHQLWQPCLPCLSFFEPPHWDRSITCFQSSSHTCRTYSSYSTVQASWIGAQCQLQFTCLLQKAQIAPVDTCKELVVASAVFKESCFQVFVAEYLDSGSLKRLKKWADFTFTPKITVNLVYLLHLDWRKAFQDLQIEDLGLMNYFLSLQRLSHH